MPRITCPTCASELDVTEDMIGQTIECGSCQAQFVAKESKKSSRKSDDDDDDRPSRKSKRRDDDDDDDDRPSRRRSSRRDDDDDDDDDDGPRRRRPSKQGGGGNGLGIAALILGIVSLIGIFCCGIFAIPIPLIGIIIGIIGSFKPESRVMSIIGASLSGLGLLLLILLLVLGVGLNLMNMNNQPNNFGPQQNNFGPPPPQPPKFKR